MTSIYKIMGEADWLSALRTGAVQPAAVDRRDGYIHLSTEEQALETARLHFEGRDDLVAAKFDAGEFGDALRWEASRGGALFPHLYGSLSAALAICIRRLSPRTDGGFDFGEEIS